MTTQRYTSNQPWITRDLKRLSRQKKRAFKKYRKSNSNRDYEKYHKLKTKSHVLCKQRYNDYINTIVMDENQKPKRLWSLLRVSGQMRAECPPLRKTAWLTAKVRWKQRFWTSSLLQFSLQRTQATHCQTLETHPIPQSPASPSPKTVCGNSCSNLIHIKPPVLTRYHLTYWRSLLARLLQPLHYFSRHRLIRGRFQRTGKLPISPPSSRKETGAHRANYRPVSLTSVCSKVLEHIVHHHVIQHMDHHQLLTDYLHGFRKRRSTETQLILTIDDLARSVDVGETSQLHSAWFQQSVRQGATQPTPAETSTLRHQRLTTPLDIKFPHRACTAGSARR